MVELIQKQAKWENTLKNLVWVCVLLLISAMAEAEDLSSCTLKKDPDEMNHCKASYAGSGGFCDLIKNGEKKRDCYFMVIKIQRNHTNQVRKPEAKKTEEEKPAAEHH